MAPIQNLLSAWKYSLPQLDDSSLPALRYTAAERAWYGIRQSKRAVVNVIDNTADYLGNGKTIITHSLSSTVLGVFERLKNRNISVIATESRPLNEGHILSRRLSELGISTQLITDAQLGLFVAQADLALLGADSLLPDGSLVNKVGSFLLALAAQDMDVPIYVCCESYQRRKEEMGEPELEEMQALELGAPSLPFVRTRNIYFDITPARLISCWTDETGVHTTGSFSEASLELEWKQPD